MKKYDVAVIGGGFTGVAIGLAVKDGCGVREVPVFEVQGILKKNGAFVGA